MPSDLWNEAHAACDGNRDAMWDWLEERYVAAVRRHLAAVEPSDEKRISALDYYEWFQACVEVGFSEEQAMVIIVRPVVNITPSQYPPEFMEAMERQSALATKLLTEMDDE